MQLALVVKWHTHSLEVAALKSMWVQVPPRAFYILGEVHE